MHIESYIEQLNEKLPDLISPSQLQRLGVFKTQSILHRMRVRGEGPPYLQITDDQIKYIKEDVLSWLRSIYCTPSIKNRSNTSQAGGYI